MTQVLIDTKVLEQVIAAMGCVGADSVCEASHHAKKDEHDGLRPCPVAERWHKAFDELRAARPMPAQDVTEPVAWLYTAHDGSVQAFTNEPPQRLKELCKPLFNRAISPVRREPMSDGALIDAVANSIAEATRPMPAESKDAERYRWLRDYLISPSTHFDDLIVSADKAETLNGVIDAARAKGTK